MMTVNKFGEGLNAYGDNSRIDTTNFSTKTYVHKTFIENQIDENIDLNNDFKIINSKEPENKNDLTTKDYVDTVGDRVSELEVLASNIKPPQFNESSELTVGFLNVVSSVKSAGVFTDHLILNSDSGEEDFKLNHRTMKQMLNHREDIIREFNLKLVNLSNEVIELKQENEILEIEIKKEGLDTTKRVLAVLYKKGIFDTFENPESILLDFNIDVETLYNQFKLRVDAE